MRIFFICQRVPFPPDRGDKITTFNEICHLSKNHEVHVFCLADGKQDLANVKGAEQYVASVTAVPVDSLGKNIRALIALFSGRSLSVQAFDVNSLHHTIKQKYLELKPDLIFVYSCNTAQYAESFTETPRIMQFADLDSLKWGQYAGRSGLFMSWIYGLEEKRLLQYERYIAHSFSHSIVCTETEVRDFERLIPGAPVSMVCNGVDPEYFRTKRSEKRNNSMVFTGVMDYLPNVDAVQWFCHEILPLIRQEIPDASFVICGSRPNPAVLNLAKIPGVTVTGWVEDIRPYLDTAQVFVAPLRMARGIQNKILEALAMELPCVSSELAWKGTVIPYGEGILASDEPREFAASAIKLLRDGSYRSDMALKARRAAETHYTWEAQMQRLDRVVEAVTASGAEKRHGV